MNSSIALARADSSQLLLIDLQPKLSAAMPDDAARAVKRAATILLTAAAALQVPVLASEQYPHGLGNLDADLRERLPATARVMAKTSFSVCGDAEIELAIAAARRPQVVLLGQEAHICVLQSAMDLLADRYQVFVAVDGVCSRSPAHRLEALERLRQAGAVIANTESILFEWLRDAAHPAFKSLSKLIR